METDEKVSRVELTKLLDSLGIVAEKLGGECNLDRVRLFLMIAIQGIAEDSRGSDQGELAKTLDMQGPTLQRNVAALSDRGDRGREPSKLVKVGFDPTDHRRRLIVLSHKGKTLAQALVARLHK